MDYSDANLAWVKQQGFTSIQLTGGSGLSPRKIDDNALAAIKQKIAQSGLYASSLAANGNHIAPDPAVRQRVNAETVGMIEIAGKLGIPYIGGQSGTLPGRPLKEQVDEIVRVYTEKYFPACQKWNVKILWEPWQVDRTSPPARSPTKLFLRRLATRPTSASSSIRRTSPGR